MAKAIRNKQIKLRKQSETEITAKAVSLFIDKMDSFPEAAKEILHVLGKYLADGLRDAVSKAYRPLAIEWEGKAHVNVEAYRIQRIAEAEAKAALIRGEAGKQALTQPDIERKASEIAGCEK